MAGATSYCGDDAIDDAHEICDGESYCDESCAFVGEAFEPNEDSDDATRLEAATDGSFSHGPDMAFGPRLFVGGRFFADLPDVQIEVCNGGTLTVRIDFVNADGNLDLRLGRRPQMGDPSGPPPVLFNWSSHSILNDFEELTVDGPPPDQIPRIHYIRVEAPYGSHRQTGTRTSENG